MTRLSVNVNKIALLRNSRGSNFPNLSLVSQDCEKFGAQGITIHPRPDERHIKYQDARDLKPLVRNEFNIEGYPSQSFMDLVLEVQPDQVTLVPDPPGALTSSEGWDTIEHASLLRDVIATLKKAGIRSSLFMEPRKDFIEGAAKVGADRIEYYTGPYAWGYAKNREQAIAPILDSLETTRACGLGINAGHDLNLANLAYFRQQIPDLLEVSIGHALVVDSLYFGLENTIQMYLRRLDPKQ